MKDRVLEDAIEHSSEEWLEAEVRAPLVGSDPFVGMEGTVEEFWAFAIPDLRMNNVRGWLAEYYVAKAVGIEKPIRIEWDDVDVRWGDIGIEVKSSALLQVWKQRSHSKLMFGGLRSRTYDIESRTYSTDKCFHADVYVFCVNTAVTHAEYNPRDLAQWTFAVLPRKTLETLNYSSLSWATVLAHSSGELRYSEIAAAIRDASELNKVVP